MKVGLVLGGGGARGAAHVGVLLELARLGVQPDMIAGTSIGGLLGALIAAGLSADEILEFFRHLQLEQLYRPPPLRTSAIASNRPIERLLEQAIGRPSFADLAIPLAVATTDLVTRQPVVLQTGDVVTAVLATIAIPLALPPVRIDEMLLVDGGLKNNLPCDIPRQMGADYVIAVDLLNTQPFPAGRAFHSGPVTKMFGMVQRQQFWTILSALVDIITDENSSHHLEAWPPDLLLRPEIGTISLFDFHRWQEGVSAGRMAVWQVEHELEALKRQQNS